MNFLHRRLTPQARNAIVGNDLERERLELPELMHVDCMVAVRGAPANVTIDGRRFCCG